MTDQNQTDDRQQALLDKLDSVKDDLASHFDALQLGKDELLRVHAAIDTARAAVLSLARPQGHDLNDDLAASPEDHPRAQGQEERPPINTDENVNQASPEGQVQPVISGAPVDAQAPAESDSAAPDAAERRVGSEDEPHAPLAG